MQVHVKVKSVLKLIIFLCATSFIFSCEVNKRHYTDGFQVYHKKSKPNARATDNKKNDTLFKVESNNFVCLNSNQLMLNQGVSFIDTLNNTKDNGNDSLSDKSNCDTIFLIDSNLVLVQLYEITDKEIRYYPCNPYINELKILKNSEVKRISFSIKKTEEKIIADYNYEQELINGKQDIKEMRRWLWLLFFWPVAFNQLRKIIIKSRRLKEIYKDNPEYRKEYKAASRFIWMSKILFAYGLFIVLLALLLIIVSGGKGFA